MDFAGMFFTVAVLLTVSVIARDLTYSQRDECPCSIDDDTGIADCSSRKLTKIPDCVPRTTRHLILTHNDLRYQAKQFQGFKNLSHLDLSGNSRFDPGNGSFTEALKLKVLYLNDTNFSAKPGVFAGLALIEKLYINDNYFIILPQDLFLGLSSLMYLDLSHESIVINGDQFSGLVNLLHLNLSYCDIGGNISFSGLTSLKLLSLSETNWYDDDSPLEMFQPLVSLEELRIEGFCDDYLPIGNCSRIDALLSRVVSLRRLYITNIVLEHPLGRGFSSLRQLQELSFVDSSSWSHTTSFCQLKYLNKNTFQYLMAAPLTKIAIHYCDIRFIFGNTFRNFNKLKSIELIVTSRRCHRILLHFGMGLSKTEIKRIRFSAKCRFHPALPRLSGLKTTKLEYLDLSEGTAERTSSSFVKSLPVTLKYLFINNNKIAYIDTNHFHILNNLLVLDLSNQQETTHASRLNRLKMQSTNKDCKPLPYSLLSLNVSNSGLLCMMAEAFCDTNLSLKTLNAAHLRNFNCLQSFWKTLRNLKSLEELDLSMNYIKEIPDNAFSEQIKLKRLYLVRNYLLELSFDVEFLTVLQYLDVKNNTIQYVSSTFRKSLQNIVFITTINVNLDGNRLLCDCKRTEFVAWLHETNVIHQKNHLSCKFLNGTELSLSRVSEIQDLLENGCIVMEVTLGCIAMFTLLHLTLIIIALCWYNRWKFNYLLSIGRRTVNPYHPLEGGVIEMEYDVYISYERDYNVTPDETLHEFVAQKLYPGLRQKGFRVLIREELDIGMRLYEVISQAARKCDKVLVLLSKSYCSDYWNVFEFNMAALEGIYTKRQVVIPIAFENVDRADLHDEVHAFLKVQPVPAYTRNSRIKEQDFIDYVSKLIRDNRPFD